MKRFNEQLITYYYKHFISINLTVVQMFHTFTLLIEILNVIKIQG